MSKTLQIAIASILSGGILVGCGEGDTGGAAASPKLAVVSSTPLNMATGVAIDQPLVIEFAEGVQEASLNGTIMLMPGTSSMAGMEGMNMGAGDVMDHSGMDMSNMAAIPGAVSCDTTVPDCKRIKFTPLMSLEWGQQYHIMVHKLRSKSGREFSGLDAVQLGFTTAFVVETKSERSLPSLNNPNYRLTETQYEPNGTGQRPKRVYRKETKNNQATYTLYNQTLGDRTGVDVRLNPGVPNTSFNSTQTDDTVVSRYTLPVRDTAGKLVGAIIYKDRGRDLKWGTADDLASSFTLRNEDHATHRLNSSFKAKAASGTSIPTVSLAALQAAKASPDWESSGASLGFFQIQTSGAPRLMKQIRFGSLGANKELDIDASGNKKPSSDDVIRDYHVYEYTGLHGSRSARKEYTSPETGPGLTLTESSDLESLSGYRVYKTATEAQYFGNAVGMLRIAEITYASGNFANIALENSYSVKDFELNFYCRQSAGDGAYEKYEIEVKSIDGTLGGGAQNTEFPNVQIEQKLGPQSGNCSLAPTQATVTGIGLTGTLQDIDENTRF